MTRRLASVWIAILLAWLALAACGDGVDGPRPLVTDVRVSAERVRGEVAVAYQLADSGGYPVQVDVQVSLDDGPWQAATPAPGSVHGGSVIPEAGRDYPFLWNSLADTGNTAARAQLRVVVRNAFGAAYLRSPFFSVANDNDAPQAAFGPRQLDDDGRLMLSVGIADKESDAVALTLRYRIDGGAWQAATVVDMDDHYNAPPDGRTVVLTWDFAHDLEGLTQPKVSVSILAEDSLGPGVLKTIGPFILQIEQAYAVELQSPGATLRGDAPVVFTVYGPRGATVDAGLGFVTAENPQPVAATLAAGYLTSAKNLLADPAGVSHRILWDSAADVSAPIARGLRLLLTLSSPGGTGFEPPASMLSEPLDVDNAKLSAGPLISEIYPGVLGDDGFIEMVGLPGTGFGQMRLYRIFKDGEPKIDTGIAFVELEGLTIGESGVFVVAGPNGPAADLVHADFAEFFPDDEPFTLVIHLAESEYFYDAVGVGDFEHAVNAAASKGEGDPTAYPPLGKSVARSLANSDANNNVLDFIISDPTPGSAPLWPVWP